MNTAMSSPAIPLDRVAAGCTCLAGSRAPLAGLIGAGIQRSLTPSMHEAEARHHGLALHYQLIDLDLAPDGAAADALPLLLRAARIMDFVGLNITYPCKQTVIPLLDTLSDEARAMGAVNTVVWRDGHAIGHNTDGAGWRWGFERALPGARLDKVVLLGAGGAGSAIAHALIAMRPGELVLVDPDRARATALLGRLAAQRNEVTRLAVARDVETAIDAATGLIHATPTGMEKCPGLPLPARCLRPDLWVSEIVYFPIETALLRAARDAGCRVADGGGMAVGQAVLAFELFTGRPADAARMDRHFRALLAAR